MGKATGNVTTVFGNGSSVSFGTTSGFAPDNAELRARIKAQFGDAFNALVAAAGWARHTPSGATATNWTTALAGIDLAALAVPGSAGSGTLIGRDWFRFDDADQAGHPIFLTFQWRVLKVGSTATYAYSVNATVTISTAVGNDGVPAGQTRVFNLYNTVTATTTTWVSVGFMDSPRTWWAAARPGFLFLRMNEPSSHSSFNGQIFLERLRTADGSDQSVDRGIIWQAKVINADSTATTTLDSGLISLDTGVNLVATSSTFAGMFAVPVRYAQGGSAESIPVFPLLHNTPTIRTSRNVMAGFPTDFAVATEVALPVPGGGTGVFKSTGTHGDGVGMAATGRLLVRWEA